MLDALTEEKSHAMGRLQGLARFRSGVGDLQFPLLPCLAALGFPCTKGKKEETRGSKGDVSFGREIVAKPIIPVEVREHPSSFGVIDLAGEKALERGP